MLRIVVSKDWVTCRNELLSRIRDDVSQQLPGRILLVPELISHDMERRLCSVAGDTASRFAEILSFPRLAVRIADRTGNSAMECLDNGGRIVAMASAARQLHSRLKVYASAETKPEFLKELVDAVDEFKRCCITSRDLMDAAGKTEGTLSQKLEELALILESYDALCAWGRKDPRDQMSWCLEQLQEDTFAQEHVFYIDGFPDFTRQHMAILEHLIRTSPMVTVGMNCDNIGSDALAFEKAGDTASQLYRCAKNAGVEVEVQVLDDPDDALLLLCQRIFQGKLPEPSVFSGRLLAVRTNSIQTEVRAAADRVMELVRGGCRYRDISIVCADMGAYEDPLRLAFRRCRIPIYQSGTEDILQKTVISTVLAAMEAALNGFEQRAVLRYMKSVLSPIDADTCDLVENYVITWGIRGSMFLKSWDRHPGGPGKDWDERAQQMLQRLNEARAIAIAPLETLYSGCRQATNLGDQVQSLCRFLNDIGFSQRLQILADQMQTLGEHREAQILNQLWEILLSALEQLHDTLGQTVWDAERFTRLLTLLLSQYDVGTIPPVLDAVTVGSVSAMRCQETRHLLVLGAAEGSLPGYGGSKGLLTDQERVALRQMGVPLTGGAVEGLQAEFAEIYGVFCGARESVYISCPGAEPSYLFLRIGQMAGGVQTVTQAVGSKGTDCRDAGGYFAQFADEQTADALGVGDWYADTFRRTGYGLGELSSEMVSSLYGKQLHLSASRVNRQAQCRMSYFLEYGLQAKERKEATFDPASFGSYVHYVLEHTARDVMEQGGFHEVSLEDTLIIAQKHGEVYAAEQLAELDSQRSEYLFRRNWGELELVIQELWQELKEAAFSPAAFELGFGDGAQMPAIQVNHGDLRALLRGYVDRMDIWEEDGKHYFRVVDYKTGAKDFDYCDIFNGVGLQMLLYLFALEQEGQQVIGGEPMAAGVQYFPARATMLSTDSRPDPGKLDKLRQKEWVRKGLLLNDQQVIHAMEPGDDLRRLNCGRDKEGKLTGEIADAKQLRMLRQYVFALLGNMVGEIASGNITPNPYTRGSSHDACTYCPYGSICHKNEVTGRRNYKTMSRQEFWERLEKEVKENG